MRLRDRCRTSSQLNSQPWGKTTVPAIFFFWGGGDATFARVAQNDVKQGAFEFSIENLKDHVRSIDLISTTKN